jgi:anti-sigma-K factor RskA
MTHDEVSELLGAFALDAVDQAEFEAIEAHLSECPRCRAEVDGHRQVAAALGNSVEALPDGLWESIVGQLPPGIDRDVPPMPLLVRGAGSGEQASAGRFRTPRSPRPGRASRPSRAAGASRPMRSRLAAVGSIAAAAAAAAIVLGVNLVHDDSQISQLQAQLGTSPHAVVEAALHTEGAKLVHVESPNHRQLAEFVTVPSGQGYLVSSKLPALPSGRTYQLWGQIGGHSISLGLLGPSPMQGTFTSARTPSALAITVEPAGGSVQPTGPLLATGSV